MLEQGRFECGKVAVGIAPEAELTASGFLASFESGAQIPPVLDVVRLQVGGGEALPLAWTAAITRTAPRTTSPGLATLRPDARRTWYRAEPKNCSKSLFVWGMPSTS
ncbi:MAG: hypothetical protein ACYDCQ_08360 [Dehalococcoidia bacterium]